MLTLRPPMLTARPLTPTRRMSVSSLWCVLAIVGLSAVSCTSDPRVDDDDTDVEVTAGAGAPATVSVRVGSLAIAEPDWRADGDNWKLRLSWEAPVGVTIDHYQVLRNGVTIAREVDGASFRDIDVEPGSRYRYEVVGVDADGNETRSATSSLKTQEPELGDARLEGVFVVRMVVEDASGTKDPVRGGAIFFSFDPMCRSGPCSVRWTVRHEKTDGTLRRDAGAYAAELRTPLFVRNCFGATIDEALDVRFRVMKAAPLRDEWRATKIEGTIGEVSSFGGCVTATIDWAVRGSLQS